MVYEGALGEMRVCAGMTKSKAVEMIEKVLRTGLVPRAQLWEQDENRNRTFVEHINLSEDE